MPGYGQLFLGLPAGKRKSHFQPSEAQIERSICDYLRIKGFFFYKQPNSGFFSGKVINGSTMIGSFRKHSSPYVKRGVPDIMVVINGRIIGLEVKSPSGRQSQDQIDFQREWEKAGARYFLVRSIEDVERCLGGVINGK